MPRENRAFASCPDEEICISGLSGFFPAANDVYELKEKLYSKVYLFCVRRLRRAQLTEFRRPKVTVTTTYMYI